MTFSSVVVSSSRDWIQFEFGAPSHSLLPTQLLLEGSGKRLGESDGWCALQYGPQLGSPRFRTALATEIQSQSSSCCHTLVHPDHLCVTSGATQSLANIALQFASLSKTIAFSLKILLISWRFECFAKWVLNILFPFHRKVAEYPWKN
jgi:DNA-binding transcriptional MocR family regulator